MLPLRCRLGFVLGTSLVFGIEVEGGRIPERVGFGELGKGDLAWRAVPLGEAVTHGFDGVAMLRRGHEEWRFKREIVLVKFKGLQKVRMLRVEPGREWEAVAALRKRKDVAFAELDTYQERQFTADAWRAEDNATYLPNDPLRSNQWHHAVIGSFEAWDYSRGEPFVRIAIVDTPFQMNHPDLVAQTDAGWDVVNEVPITNSGGIEHSTICAGMAGASINNTVGVAGAGNCRLVPININGALSEMHNAVIWAADRGIRVVSISWTGGNSDTVNEAGEYLRTKARGVLLMAGVNGTGFLDYTNQPHIYCVSMTDAADNMRSRFGNHIDLAAPGWDVYSTTTGGGYRFDTGTSYATPLVAGIAAVLLSINPILTGDEAMDLLKDTAEDFGSPGWDQFFGWGRVNFGAAAAVARATVPAITSIVASNGQARLETEFKAGLAYELWRSGGLEVPTWEQVTNVVVVTNGARVTLVDPVWAEKRFYRVRFVGR